MSTRREFIETTLKGLPLAGVTAGVVNPIPDPVRPEWRVLGWIAADDMRHLRVTVLSPDNKQWGGVCRLDGGGLLKDKLWNLEESMFKTIEQTRSDYPADLRARLASVFQKALGR